MLDSHYFGVIDSGYLDCFLPMSASRYPDERIAAS
jgi:hypothetical protein